MKFWTQMNVAQIFIYGFLAVWSWADWFVNREVTALFWSAGFTIMVWLNHQSVKLRKLIELKELREPVSPPGLTAEQHLKEARR